MKPTTSEEALAQLAAAKGAAAGHLQDIREAADVAAGSVGVVRQAVPQLLAALGQLAQAADVLGELSAPTVPATPAEPGPDPPSTPIDPTWATPDPGRLADASDLIVAPEDLWSALNGTKGFARPNPGTRLFVQPGAVRRAYADTVGTSHAGKPGHPLEHAWPEGTADDPIEVWALEGPGSVQLARAPKGVGITNTLQVDRADFLDFYGLDIEGGTLTGIACGLDHGKRLRFLACNGLGGFDHLQAPSGANWGAKHFAQVYNPDGWLWDGLGLAGRGVIADVQHEQCVYGHNVLGGGLRIARAKLARCGRSALQVRNPFRLDWDTYRDPSSGLTKKLLGSPYEYGANTALGVPAPRNAGLGPVELVDVEVEDSNLYTNATAVTLAGRFDPAVEHTLERVKVSLGATEAISQAAKGSGLAFPGGGAVILWDEGTTKGWTEAGFSTTNGRVVMRDVRLANTPAAGGPPLLRLPACELVTLEDVIVDQRHASPVAVQMPVSLPMILKGSGLTVLGGKVSSLGQQV